MYLNFTSIHVTSRSFSLIFFSAYFNLTCNLNKYGRRGTETRIDTTARYRHCSRRCTVLRFRVLQLKLYMLLFYTLQAIQKKNGHSVLLEILKKVVKRPRRVWEENFKRVFKKVASFMWLSIRTRCGLH